MTRKIKCLGVGLRRKKGSASSVNLGRKMAALVATGYLLTFPVSGYPESNVTYSYDALGRVTSIAYTDGTKTTTVTYTYDASGNRSGTIVK